MEQIEKIPIIIVGGGITGIAAALFLSQQGVKFILIEKHPGTSIFPRARTIDVRTMELFRSLGLCEVLREGGKALAPAWGIIRGNNLVEALQNPVGKVTPDQLQEAQQEIKTLGEKSPETTCRCTQDISEAIMCQAALIQDLHLRFNHRMMSFEQIGEELRVLVQNRETEEEYAITANYMIAADGANSMVRNQLKIPSSGNGPATDLLHIYFKADMEALVKGREFSQFLIDTPEITGFLLTINNKDTWAFHLRFHPEHGETLADYPEEKLIPILHRVLCVADLQIKILKVLPWQLRVSIANEMQAGQIFLAGDSAHTMTPYAGKGANTGIQDVQNLAWKLAAVIKQQAGYNLLDTYQTERQPVGAFYATLSGELADQNGLINDTLMISKGKYLMGLPNYGYQSSAVLRATDLPFTYFTGEPGTRIPHLWLDELHTQSSIDWVKGRFTLIANNDNGWELACKQIKEQLDIEIQFITLKNQHILNDWMTLTNTMHAEALLVRPDDFIAAKSTPKNILNVLSAILSR